MHKTIGEVVTRSQFGNRGDQPCAICGAVADIGAHVITHDGQGGTSHEWVYRCEAHSSDVTSPVERVRVVLSMRWTQGLLHEDILNCELDSTCGRRIQAICAAADALLAITNEEDTEALVSEAVVDELNAIYFG